MFNRFPIPAWSLISNPYYHLVRNKKSLLITAGDSWTYGDSLGKTKVRLGIDDTEYRLNNIYGKLLADRIDADWINFALPGASNQLIINWLTELLLTITDYNSIICVITLTESGRHEELSLIDKLKYPTLKETLDGILCNTYQQISLLQEKYKNIKFLIAHNFTDGITSSDVQLTDKTWLEVLLNKPINNSTRIVVSEHIGQMNYVKKFIDRLDVIELAEKRIDLLDNCMYCNSGDTRHPTEQGHKLWSDYLWTKI